MGKSREPTSGDDKPPTRCVSLSVMTIGKNANNPLFYPVTVGCKTLFPAIDRTAHSSQRRRRPRNTKQSANAPCWLCASGRALRANAEIAARARFERRALAAPFFLPPRHLPPDCQEFH